MKKSNKIDMFVSSSSDIGLAEILMVFDTLAPESDYTKKKIVNFLNFEWQTNIPIIIKENEPISSTVMVQSQSKKHSSSKKESNTGTTQTTVLLTPSYTKEILDDVDFSVTDLNDSRALSETNIKLHFEKPNYIPLLNRRWFQGIMSAMLSTQIQSRNMDFKLIENSFFKLLPISNLPYLYRSTLNKGVQILLDSSISMQPFWRDESELIHSLYRLFNAHNTQIYEFELNLNPIPQLIWNEDVHFRLQAEVPILLVTNFGAIGRTGLGKIRECMELIQLVEQAKIKKCPIIALIPAAKKHYPKDISDFIPFTFTWDSDISPQKVYRIKRK